MKLPFKKNELVVIVWHDAVNQSVRITDPGREELATNFNIGWILHEDAKRVILAHGSSTTGEFDSFKIPVSCILERQKLREQRSPSTPSQCAFMPQR